MKELICIVCPKGCHLEIDEDNDYSVSGNACFRGETYGKEELLNPTRVLISTVCIRNGLYPRLPVKTTAPIPKGSLFEAMALVNKIDVAAPIKCGEVLIKDILNTGVDLVATRPMALSDE